MFFILSKILFFLLQPLVWVVFLLLYSIKTKSKNRGKILKISAIIILLVFSNKFIFNEVSRVWENSVPAYTGNETFDVAIVLGGISSIDKTHQQIALYGNAERLMNILPLYFEGKVKKILFAGGSGRLDQQNVEAVHIKEYLISLGVKERDILLDAKSKNTFENAKYSLQLIDSTKSILLSTSAAHMPRSLACFKKQGANPTPFPVDFMSYETNRFQWSNLFVPNPGVFSNWYWLLHEWVGILSYKMKGYC